MNHAKSEMKRKGHHGHTNHKPAKLPETSESAREEIEKRLKDILASSERAVAIVGSHLEILAANVKCRQLLGYQIDDLIGKTTLELTLPEDRPRTQANERDLWSGRVPTFEMDKYYVKSDGTPVRAYLRSFIINNDLGEPICEMKIIDPLNQNLSLIDKLFDRVVSSFNFPELMRDLPV
jgi:PAS domain S-box-containing protein